MMFPPMLTKKTSKSGFPLNNDTRESIMGKVDSGEPSGWPSAKQPYLKKPRKKVEQLRQSGDWFGGDCCMDSL